MSWRRAHAAQVIADFEGTSAAEGIDLSVEAVQRALDTYKAVQAHNLATQQCDSRQAYGSLGDVTGMMASLRSRPGASACKSALLRRLLEGKRALRYPPPTEMARPAYHAVENGSGFRVSLEGRARGSGALRIEQCNYEIVDMNDPARRLLALFDGPAFDGKAFADLADNAPSWLLRFGRWPEWELTVGMLPAGRCRRRFLETSSMSPHRQQALWGGWGPMEVVAIEVPGAGAYQHLLEDVARLPELRAAQVRGVRLAPADLAVVEAGDCLIEDAATTTVADHDWVLFRQQGWVLRHSPAWKGFSDLYFDRGVAA